MEFDKQDMAILGSLNEIEAQAFIKFLLSERRRHERDIKYIDERIRLVWERFGWTQDIL